MTCRQQKTDRNARIVELREQGVGPREIARRLQVSPQTVAGVLFRAGLTKPTSGRGNGVTDDVKRAATAVAADTSIRRAAAAFGVSKTTFLRWRKEIAA